MFVKEVNIKQIDIPTYTVPEHKKYTVKKVDKTHVREISTARRPVILEKIVQFQNQKSWKMNSLELHLKHVILKICNILTSDTKFYPHRFNGIRVRGC